MKSFVAAMILCGVFLYFGTQAKADEWNKRTTLTFSAPVEVPGRVLPAGTYVFKLMDSPSDRHIVEVFDKNQMHLITTLVAVPDERLEPRGKTVITFEERASGSPEALRAWFYPGDNVGQEFVYPESRAREIARQSHEHVLYMRDHNGDLRKAEIRGIEPSGEEVDLGQVHKRH